MNPRELTELETALGFDQPLPWPQSIQEEIELTELRLAADLPPTARRASKDIARIHEILDELLTKEGQTA